MDVEYGRFLRWAYPSPHGNLVRGHLAEHLVGEALGCAGDARTERWPSLRSASDPSAPARGEEGHERADGVGR